MVTAERTIPVVHKSVEDAIRDLRDSVARMERIYEMSSEDMLQAVSNGERSGTAEIVRWMNQYARLQHLAA